MDTAPAQYVPNQVDYNGRTKLGPSNLEKWIQGKTDLDTMNMSFLPKELRYQDTDIYSSYGHLLEKNKKLVSMLDGMAKKKPNLTQSNSGLQTNSLRDAPKKDTEFRVMPPPRSIQDPATTNGNGEEGSMIDRMLLKFGCIKR